MKVAEINSNSERPTRDRQMQNIVEIPVGLRNLFQPQNNKKSRLTKHVWAGESILYQRVWPSDTS